MTVELTWALVGATDSNLDKAEDSLTNLVYYITNKILTGCDT